MDKFRLFWKYTSKYHHKGNLIYNALDDDVDFKNIFIAYEYKQSEILYFPSSIIITYMMTGKYYETDY